MFFVTVILPWIAFFGCLIAGGVGICMLFDNSFINCKEDWICLCVSLILIFSGIFCICNKHTVKYYQNEYDIERMSVDYNAKIKPSTLYDGEDNLTHYSFFGWDYWVYHTVNADEGADYIISDAEVT
ncbi:MAG: hypothetical protein IIT65_01320 [Lachnospiraceae bacterium]|nr:hypothetical protein [Lachnospiraceae bacterium]